MAFFIKHTHQLFLDALLHPPKTHETWNRHCANVCALFSTIWSRFRCVADMEPGNCFCFALDFNFSGKLNINDEFPSNSCFVLEQEKKKTQNKHNFLLIFFPFGVEYWNKLELYIALKKQSTTNSLSMNSKSSMQKWANWNVMIM